MKKRIWAGALLLLIATIACKERAKKEVAPAIVKHEFKPVTIPSAYTDPEQRATYYVTHLWEHFDFADTALIHLPDITERAFASYVQALHAVPKAKAAAAVKQMLKQADREPLMLRHFATLYEKYIYDPNSPFMNEELYIPVLETVSTSAHFDEEQQTRAAHRLEMAFKNRMGEKANNFTFTIASGKKMQLYNIKSEYILIFFNNPGCTACKMYRDAMCASSMITGLVQQNRLKVVAIYPDEDLAEWRAYLPQIPAEWINGYDESLALRGEKLYNLRAIPTLYLLDENKKVLLKDARVELLEQYLVATVTPRP
jgi:thiol-disulfide isomerase/thioredoxin